MKPLALTILLIASLITATTGCSRGYRFIGIVVDGQGVGIDEAHIILYPHDEQKPESTTGQKTKNDGSFEATWGCTPGIKFFRMTVFKTGYDDDNRIVSADEKDIRVVLSRSSKASE
jgi:hypothetical protein